MRPRPADNEFSQIDGLEYPLEIITASFHAFTISYEIVKSLSRLIALLSITGLKIFRVTRRRTTRMTGYFKGVDVSEILWLQSYSLFLGQ